MKQENQKINSDMGQTDSKELNAFLRKDENLPIILSMHFLRQTHDKTKIYAKGKTVAEGTANVRNTRQRKAAAATLPSDRNGFSSFCEQTHFIMIQENATRKTLILN